MMGSLSRRSAQQRAELSVSNCGAPAAAAHRVPRLSFARPQAAPPPPPPAASLIRQAAGSAPPPPAASALPPVGECCYGAAVLVEVAVGAPVRGSFTYEADGGVALLPGQRLLVPFGRRRAIGFYLGPAASAPEGPIKKIEEVLDERPQFTPELLALIRFAADYYLYPLGEALRGALPPSMGRVGATAPAKERAPTIEAVSLLEPVEVALAALSRAPGQRAIVEHLAARGGSATLAELAVALKGAPALVRKLAERGLVTLRAQAPQSKELSFSDERPLLTAEQERAVSAIDGSAGSFRPFLLHGVTGSGKTEVYLHAIERARARGRGALVLVPEIALTPQLAGRFRSRFGAEVAVLHSGLSDRERSKEHQRLVSGEASIAVGVRSAVFAPVQELGILIVDEEHESSFKQEEKLRYHARDLAIYRARLVSSPCVLGSATPSLESLLHSREGRYGLLEMRERVDDRPLPPVELVDLAAARKERSQAAGAGDREDSLSGGAAEYSSEQGGAAGHSSEATRHSSQQGAAAGHRGGSSAPSSRRGPEGARSERQGSSAGAPPIELFSPQLSQALEETLANGKQAILFLNRRGHASLVLCASCGESARCRSCDVTLTHHLSRQELRCHYCDFRTPKPESCPSCYGELLVLGVGTERVEKELQARFPQAKIARLDRDAIGSSAQLTQILASFARGEADILIGTQMVAKGHDFPGVTLVGVILADVGLGLPDFRAAERTFQLLTQVAGRAGRGEDAGRVVIQTFNPEVDAISSVQGHDYERFSAAELERRRELGYPPYRRALAIRVEARDESAAERAARRLSGAARRLAPAAVQILGPAPAPIARLRGKSRFQLLLLAPGAGPLQALGRRLVEEAGRMEPSVKIAFDVDPVSML